MSHLILHSRIRGGFYGAILFLSLQLLASPLFAAEKEYTAVTFNIRFGALGIQDIAKTLQQLNPDFVFLQEVHGPPVIPEFQDQAKFLGKALGLHVFFAPSQHWLSGEYGLAILSRFPFLEKNTHLLPDFPGVEPEILLEGRIATPEGELNLYCTHLTANAKSYKLRSGLIRRLQAEKVLEIINKHSNPALLGADLNSFGTSRIKKMFRRQMVDLFDTVGAGRRATFPAGFPLVGIDYLFVKGPLKPLAAKVIKAECSDHRPLWGKISMAPVAVSPTISVRESISP